MDGSFSANSVVPFTVHLHQQAYTFKRGHRIMVQVQSTWFPLYDRNPQTFVPNIFKARAGDYRPRPTGFTVPGCTPPTSS
jgi:predicted acyl esterase